MSHVVVPEAIWDRVAKMLVTVAGYCETPTLEAREAFAPRLGCLIADCMKSATYVDQSPSTEQADLDLIIEEEQRDLEQTIILAQTDPETAMRLAIHGTAHLVYRVAKLAAGGDVKARFMLTELVKSHSDLSETDESDGVSINGGAA